MPLPQHLLNRIPALPVDKDEQRATPPESLNPAFAEAAAITRHHAKSFFFASRFLGPQQRKEAYAVYSYCRYIDDLVDERGEEALPPDRSDLLAESRQMREGVHPSGFAPAFAWTCEARGIPMELLDELVEGCCRDRSRVRIQTGRDLEEYCYLVASVVGLMMCRIFGVSSADAYPRAVEMGLAMQLTNILRDIAEDFEKDRIYLPADALQERGLSVERLLESGPDASWKLYLRERIATARDWYQSAEAGLPFLRSKTCARTARVMGRVYSGILTEIERSDFDVRTRHYVSLPRKLLLALAIVPRRPRRTVHAGET